MRTEEEVTEFCEKIKQKIFQCKKCNGQGLHSCSCSKKAFIKIQAFEACIPKDFWFIKKEDVTHNKKIFEKKVLKYCENLNKALNKGYGLVFLGDNGVGKTYFISYILMKAIKENRTAYYTTLPNLDYNLKRSFKDQTFEKRLNYMLTSDFVAIDEVGKEQHKKELSYTDVQVERILKQRCDDSLPIILATNLDVENLFRSYGSTVESVLRGKCSIAQFEAGDFRRKLSKKMKKDMGYE